jgi:hypothetical protein
MSSSRRTNGEINILAMLDGHAPGRRLFARPAVLWYGVAGVAACSLLVALAWLVRGETPARDTATAAAVRGASHDAETPAYTARDSIQVAVPSMHTAPADDALVPATTRGAIVVDVAPPAPATVPAPAAATAILAAPAHAAARHPPERPPASRPAPSLAHADAASRQKRAPARAAPDTVDTDVALISAILQHTGTRNESADGAGTAPCADKSCNARLPSRQ